MNQSGTDSGQSMEDILASIRRIIAEGEQDAKDGPPATTAAEPPKPAPPKAEVFELTQIVQEDGSVVSVSEEAAKAAAAEPAAAEVKAEAAAVVEKLVAPEVLAEKVPAPAPATDAKVESAMAALSRLMEVAKAPDPEAPAASPERPKSLLTVEELVRDAVRPLLRQWLDANLPPLVERAVREAVEKLAKRAG